MTCTDGPLEGRTFDLPFPAVAGMRLTLPLLTTEEDKYQYVYIVDEDPATASHATDVTYPD